MKTTGYFVMTVSVAWMAVAGGAQADTTNRSPRERPWIFVTGEKIEALFDSEQWPEWADKAHIQVGLKADLRHGQFAKALGMAYDWLYDLLTEEERRRFLDGLDRCAIRPFKAGVEAGEHWLNGKSNWMTCVVGGFGILGMALGPDHPDSAWLVELARPRMERYMSIFGPEGEFNESVQYSGSTMYVVDYQQWGHNVLVFGANETGGIPLGRARRGKTTHAEFDDRRGGAWTMDLSEAYREGHRVVRHVVHMLPRIAVVLDEAELGENEPISLRWHTIAPAEPDDEGRFTVRGEAAALAACVQRLDGDAEMSLGRHEYRPPYDRDRLGNPYTQRHEPFVEIRTENDRCRILSMFCVFGPDEQAQPWQERADGWSIETPEGPVQILVKQDRLAVENTATQHTWQIQLPPQQ